MTRFLSATTIFIYTLLSGCGGSSSSSDPSNPSDNSATGVLLDSPVVNIDFQTASQSGSTNNSGEFSFQPGEEITFSIGDITLPSVTASELVTPLDMSDQKDLDVRVVNVLRFLQTLDEDGDPDNGLTITESAKNAGAGLSIDFDKTVTDFENDQNVVNLVNSEGASQLVTETAARNHFRQTLASEGISTDSSIVGTYAFSSGDAVLVFAESGAFYMAEFNSTEIQSDELECVDPVPECIDPTGAIPEECNEFETISSANCNAFKDSAFEVGKYSFVDNVLNWNISDDRNGQVGILNTTPGESHEETEFRVTTLDNSQLSLENVNDATDTVDFDRVNSQTGSLSGAWFSSSSEGQAVLVFDGSDTSGTYYLLQLDEANPLFEGVEKGTYTRDSTSGDLTATSSVDYTGEAGLAVGVGSSGSFTFTVDGDTLTGSDGSGSFTLQRIDDAG